MNLPKPDSYRYTELLNKIECGKLRIPQFQRDFVWSIQKSAELLDSIIKGYPIGTFIIWRTSERLKTIGKLGSLALKEPDESEKVEYVLDGQQRITSLYVALRGETIGKTDYSKIYINLEADSDEDIVITDVSSLDENAYIPFGRLMKYEIMDFMEQFGDSKAKIKLIDDYRHHIENYNFSVVEVSDVPIETATEIFTRINVGGEPLTVFEIMCAKVYDKASEFDLAEKFKEFTDSLSEICFDTIPPIIPLQLIGLITNKSCKGKDILGLNKDNVIAQWADITSALKSAIDFARASFGVQSSKLLPYDALLIPIAYYIYKTRCPSPTGKDAKYLSDMFWRYSLMERYNNGTEGKLSTDISIIDEIIKGDAYKPAVSVELSESYLREKGTFRMGKGITKSVICLLLLHQPLRLDSEGQKVLVDDKQLTKGNGKNYHHFFPRAYMRKNGFDEELVDNVVNIIVVDDYTNKYRIKDKAPSVYIGEFAAKNKKIGDSLASHLIGDFETYGICNNDYNAFYSKRAEWINQEFAKRMCLDSEVVPDDEFEDIDTTAKEVYIAIWGLLDATLKKAGNPISINAISTSKVQTSCIIPAKVDLRFLASIRDQNISCELVFRDDAVFNQFLVQKSDFESLCGIKSLVWSDQTAKTKKIILDYGKATKLYDKSKYDNYVKWFVENGTTMKEATELFAEDMNIGTGIAPNSVDDPKMVFCITRAIKAAGLYHGKSVGFEVLKESGVRLSTKAYGAAQQKREDLIKAGIIARMADGKGEFKEDFRFSTPSQAANVVLGGSNNGWIIWKDATGEKSLDELYRKHSV